MKRRDVIFLSLWASVGTFILIWCDVGCFFIWVSKRWLPWAKIKAFWWFCRRIARRVKPEQEEPLQLVCIKEGKTGDRLTSLRCLNRLQILRGEGKSADCRQHFCRGAQLWHTECTSTVTHRTTHQERTSQSSRTRAKDFPISHFCAQLYWYKIRKNAKSPCLLLYLTCSITEHTKTWYFSEIWL